MLAFIDAAETMDELFVPHHFGFHELTGDRKGTCSITVTRNWRLTFKLNEEGVLEMRRLRELEDENGRLKKIVADLTLDREMLKDVIKRKL